MKPTSQQYRAAAELIDSGRDEYACRALNRVLYTEGRRFPEFQKLFYAESPQNSVWLTDWRGEDRAHPSSPLGRKVRVMALLMMAYMTEVGDV